MKKADTTQTQYLVTPLKRWTQRKYVDAAVAQANGVSSKKVAKSQIVEITTDEVWVPIEKGDWIIGARLVIQNGRPVVGELRIIPRKFSYCAPAESEAFLKGVHARAPGGGLTRSFLTTIPFGVFHSEIAKMQGMESQPGSVPSELLQGLFPPKGRNVKRGRGRPGRPLLFYAEIAQDYAKASAAGDLEPIRTITQKRPHLDRGKVRDSVNRARKLGFLTVAQPGRPGGQLTPLARAALREHGKRKKGTKWV